MIEIYDHSSTPIREDALRVFAFEELLGREVGEQGQPVIHFWRHAGACILGLRDRQLPDAEAAMDALRADGYDVIVRHSGGAAVPLDAGVLNVSVVFPHGAGQMDFKDDFQWFADVIIRACARVGVLGVAIGEIAGSYCPGAYDLSVDGRKFCGIAQRRQTKSTIVHAFVLVEGDAEARAGVAKRYYDVATATGLVPEADYPRVEPTSLRSLAAWEPGLTVAAMQQALVESFANAIGKGLRPDIRADWRFAPEAIDEMAASLRQRHDRNK
jgi:octanoyl-[GcvH]:protein N-octanoyltransferase